LCHNFEIAELSYNIEIAELSYNIEIAELSYNIEIAELCHNFIIGSLVVVVASILTKLQIIIKKLFLQKTKNTATTATELPDYNIFFLNNK
jgi:hypothetical protein